MEPRDEQPGRLRDRIVGVAVPATLRGLLLMVLAPSVTVLALVFAVVSLALTPVGIGLVAFPEVMLGVRRLAGAHRRWAGEWSGVAVAEPYRPAGAGGYLATCRRVFTDPATWRDLGWLAAEAPVGLVLGALAMAPLVYGIEGVLVGSWLPAVVGGYGWGPVWGAGYPAALLAVPLGLALVGASPVVAPRALRVHALFVHSLLAPTESAALARRVGELTESRGALADLSAAELRRIERDLHDGAQARLAALGMTLGLAESLFPTDPEAAMRLVAEARETGNQALADLRALVRGIHPPVLAERGLVGAVRALALSLPVEVEVVVVGDEGAEGVDAGPGGPGGPAARRFPAPVEAAAYFAVAEALANTVKHSGAGRARVVVGWTEAVLRATVWDDGIGGAAPGPDGGLAGVRRRLAAFDGTIEVVSPVGGPTLITLELPCGSSSPRTSPS